MPQPPQSPFARLVLFMIGLAIAGTVVAGLHYFAVDLPQQQNVQAPTNVGLCTQVSCLPKGGPMGGPDRL
jgi:hypothetical protein